MLENVTDAIEALLMSRDDASAADVARAAVEAMRQPTMPMMEAVAIAPADWVRPEQTWLAMIDAALGSACGTT